MDIQTLNIETERLILVPTTEKYAQDIFDNFDKDTTRYMFPKTADDISETLSWIKSVLDKRNNSEELQMTILDKNTLEFLGNAGLHKIKTQFPELGIWIKKSAYGKKIGREAIEALAERANHNLDFEYITYPVDKDNIPSRKIAESCGGILELDKNGNELVEQHQTMDTGRVLNGVLYKIYKK